MMHRLFLVFFLLLSTLSATVRGAEVPEVHGAIESWSYDPTMRQVSLRGWSLGGGDGQQPPELILNLGGKSMNRQDWS